MKSAQSGELKLNEYSTRKKAEEAYDRAVERRKKQMMLLANHWRRRVSSAELEWEAYQKACKERTNAAVEHIIVKEAIRRCNLQL
ncbi:uncharacterized protein OCT59_015081 [Rhizophagus irregularis]|uniref:uncharacterized protein n=1 Tax=Rhizophagus irregularis TaxID=588596 RepID=UPI0033172040|nr:hypothetical protein OCT59_015081 [Rhizophagus irregularis]